MRDATILQRFQWWYFSECNGDWEHQHGITINTIDNPGWGIRIDLSTTPADARQFNRFEIERAEDDWIHAWVEDHKWNAACGPLNLEEALGLFVAWTESAE
jgi:hypothetical protein